MSAFETVDYTKRDDGIAVLTLNRPESLNAFNMQMRDEVYEVLTAVRDDADVRGLLVTGAGKRAFCVGADLTEFGSAPSQAIARDVRFERDVWGLWLSIHKPMVAAIRGYCLGSGTEIASVCDIRIAANDAVFGMPEVGLGLIPAAGGTQLLPRLLGVGRALDLLLTGERFTATKALEYGLVTQVVAQADLESTAIALLSDILSATSTALTAAKRAVLEGLGLALPQAVGLERRLAESISR
jgi:enoyl-CoA hydratase/carnithine racemase